MIRLACGYELLSGGVWYKPFASKFFALFSVCVSVRACMLVTQLCLTLCNPVDCSPPGSSVCEILQARILVKAAVPFSRGSS